MALVKSLNGSTYYHWDTESYSIYSYGDNSNSKNFYEYNTGIYLKKNIHSFGERFCTLPFAIEDETPEEIINMYLTFL